MRIITVSGAHSGIGKTAFIEQIMPQLKGWSALKVTAIKNNSCPRAISCGICEKQRTAFSICSSLKIINQSGKDTQRMKSAGARKVLWLKAKPQGLKEGLRRALIKLKNAKGVVIEGTSILKYLKPDLGIFIYTKGKAGLLKCSLILTQER